MRARSIDLCCGGAGHAQGSDLKQQWKCERGSVAKAKRGEGSSLHADKKLPCTVRRLGAISKLLCGGTSTRCTDREKRNMLEVEPGGGYCFKE